ncbi:hypothetical protein DPEC_G00363340 [Dallia pectoralis]|nr:hypothetical protein DPEC_G00363340 [Dallia pectoralis]
MHVSESTSGTTKPMVSMTSAQDLPPEVLRQREVKWLDMLSNWDKWMARRHNKEIPVNQLAHHAVPHLGVDVPGSVLAVPDNLQSVGVTDVLGDLRGQLHAVALVLIVPHQLLDPPLTGLELESAITIFYHDNEVKANDLKAACRTNWTGKHDTFEVAVDLLESLLLCMDSVQDNEDLRWSDQVTQNALEITEALADFEFVVTLLVLKNTLSFTRAFGKNLQGSLMDVYFAANSLTAVLHSLNEVSDNIDVYHEFWFEEAVNLANALDIPVKVPRLFLRMYRPENGTEIQPESYFKDNLTAPVVSHVIKELNELFSENHLNALRCLTLVPAVMGQLKFNTSEENNVEMYRKDLPNADTFPAELHCWRVKWKHRGKVSLPSTVHETLQLADVKFFPNVLAFLRVLCNLPILSCEDLVGNASRKRFQMYLENTPDKHRSKSLAFLNIHNNAQHDLDFMVDSYIRKYPD